jgi:hypothetical protein
MWQQTVKDDERSGVAFERFGLVFRRPWRRIGHLVTRDACVHYEAPAQGRAVATATHPQAPIPSLGGFEREPHSYNGVWLSDEIRGILMPAYLPSNVRLFENVEGLVYARVVVSEGTSDRVKLRTVRKVLEDGIKIVHCMPDPVDGALLWHP